MRISSFTLIKVRCEGNHPTLIRIMVAKSLLRNAKPIIIAISTNDGLGLNLENIGHLLPNQSVYFVPFGQDNCVAKPYSLVADLNLVPETLQLALEGKQIQPMLIKY
ncbi:hypothetical protein [Niameybacter sp.]|uniref:hypothetical protein n=1 Tax=Niameybacter sp. TaxID=2033640 RepID=UPI002FC88500